MKVILTVQSITRLEQSLRFQLEELQIPKDQVVKIKNKLIEKAKSLSVSPYKGQYEPYLSKLKKGHRRLIEGNFKIVYRVEGNIIYVVDFFDSRDNPMKMKG
ncbi:type II toxin-antitoxin system RelE/ParE family toxin [Marivirga sp.]|uniref:type II toxin-antitoxin system RelE/ParE family toxin n=1 Tax=Marivirga sp. TaxID=2018662 RepID=UPI002D7E72BB|nr:type II toxin-antitoxin system RelE/ParE family toxin [Marivirga sp.]HET8858373.1 type II toxin-antitoxin system RelE/ParE family toxin [Marivirga sp.]